MDHNTHIQHDLEIVQWTHPRHGEITEMVCVQHRGDVLIALKTLGIGCTGRRPQADDPFDHCARCQAQAAGVEPRFWLELAG